MKKQINSLVQDGTKVYSPKNDSSKNQPEQNANNKKNNNVQNRSEQEIR